MHCCLSARFDPRCRILLASLLLCIASPGCARLLSPQPQRISDPPGPARSPVVADAMNTLLGQSRELGRVLLQPNLPSERDRIELDEILARMQRTLGALEVAGGDRQHPLLDAHLDEFRGEIGFARERLQLDPPDYLQVAVVRGACVYCHTVIPDTSPPNPRRSRSIRPTTPTDR